MQHIFHRDDHRVGIVIITGSCCIPGMAAFDAQARRIVEQAVVETGIEAQVQMMPAITAMMGGVPKEVMGKLIGLFQAGQIPVPAVLVNGQGIAYGVPNIDVIKAALGRIAAANIVKEEQTNE